MKVVEVVVEVHEKRSHPDEHGHFDASVRLTAEVEDGAYDDLVILRLREIARMHVAQECDDWVASIREDRRIGRLENRIGAELRDFWYFSDERGLEIAKGCLRLIGELPEAGLGRWEEVLAGALAGATAEARERAEAAGAVRGYADDDDGVPL